MKHFYSLFTFLACIFIATAQTNPTLNVGLETLTMNKGTIDVEVLTKIISEKQKELKGEALKRFMLKMFPDTDYTTKFYVQNCLNILINEKNPKVIEKEVLELTTNYALAMGVTYALIKSNDEGVWRVDDAYVVYSKSSNLDVKASFEKNSKIITKIRGTGIFKSSLLDLEDTRFELKQKIEEIAKDMRSTGMSLKEGEEFEKITEELEHVEEKLYKIKQRREIAADDNAYNIIKDAYFIIKKNTKDSVLLQHIRKLDIESAEAIVKPGINNYDEISKQLTKIRCLGIEIENISNNNRITADIPNLHPKRHIPFGMLLDVVSLSLSDMEQLKKKGFFKNPIDYRTDTEYLKLGETEEGRMYRDKLDNFKKSVCDRIEPYIEHYDIIKELIQTAKLKDKSKIVGELKAQAIKIIEQDSTVLSGTKEFIAIAKEVKKYDTFSDVLEELKFWAQMAVEIPVIDKNLAIEEAIHKINNKAVIINSFIGLIDKDFRELYKENTEKDLISFNNAVVVTSDFYDIKPIPVQSDDPQAESINGINGLIDEFINGGKKDFSVLNKIISGYGNLKGNVVNPIKIKGNREQYNKLLDALESGVGQVKEINDELGKLSIEKIKEKIDLYYKREMVSDKAFNGVIRDLFKKVIDSQIDIGNKDTVFANKTAAVFTGLYSKLNTIIKSEKASLADIRYFEKEINERIIALKIRDTNPQNEEVYKSLMSYTDVIVPLLKIKALQGIDLGKYDEELMTLFEFIANLNKLDEAETFTSIIDMLRTGSKQVEDNLENSTFKDEYMIFINAIKKYTLVNTNENYVEVDVASFLTDLQAHYKRNDTSFFSLYLSIGLNENIFLGKSFKIPDVSDEPLKNIGFASEKLGLEFRLLNFKKYRGYKNVIKDDLYLNKKAPFVNSLYAIVYGSGLLYSLANTATNENFDFAHIGTGVGVRFYNALDVNAIIGFPFVKDSNFGKYKFIGLGLDIPLGEYLEKLGQK